MAAAQFIGRVGGLAVAIGIGTAVVPGGATAWADSDSIRSDDSARPGGADSAKPTAGGRARGGPAATRSSAGSSTRPNAGRGISTAPPAAERAPSLKQDAPDPVSDPAPTALPLPSAATPIHPHESAGHITALAPGTSSAPLAASAGVGADPLAPVAEALSWSLPA
nr:hypothetical protein [Mycobacterium sp.]